VEYKTPNEKIGNNVTFCDGQIIVGKKFYHMLFTETIITLFNIALFILIVMAFRTGIAILLVVLLAIIYSSLTFCLFRAGSTDPGIFERRYDYAIRFLEEKKCNFKVVIQGHLMRLSICYTCNILRPPRTSHCAVCDNCVEKFDHHCIWLGTCVGKRNYKYFFFFLSSCIILAVYSIAVCTTIIVQKSNKNTYFDTNHFGLYMGLPAAMIFVCTCFLVFFLLSLFWTHLQLVVQNLTFYEFIKEKWSKYPTLNPSDKESVTKNVKYSLCRSVPHANLELNKKNDNQLNFKF